MNDHNPVPPPLVLVDGHNLLWRAAFGFPARIRAKDGTDRTAAFGFMALLRAARKEVDATSRWLVCFDGQLGLADRKAVFEGYKDGRVERDINPIEFLEEVKNCLNVSDVSWVEIPDAEADDVISSVVAREVDRLIFIMSSDRDYYQLLNDRVRVLNTSRRPGKMVVSADTVRSDFGVEPRQWCDFRAITGDTSDAIPGVPGFGPVKAARLLHGGAVLDDLPPGANVPGRLGDLLRAEWPRVLRNRDLMRLNSTRAFPTPTPSSLEQLPAAAAVLTAAGLF